MQWKFKTEFPPQHFCCNYTFAPYVCTLLSWGSYLYRSVHLVKYLAVKSITQFLIVKIFLSKMFAIENKFDIYENLFHLFICCPVVLLIWDRIAETIKWPPWLFISDGINLLEVLSDFYTVVVVLFVCVCTQTSNKNEHFQI